MEILVLLVIWGLLSHGGLSLLDPITISFPTFSEGTCRGGELSCMGNASSGSSNGSVLGYVDLTTAEPGLSERVGRVLYKRPVMLWPCNFVTTFTVSLACPENVVRGEGMAFIMVANDRPSPEGSSGAYLGLFNKTTQENTWDQVAVEIDTFLNEFDPNYIHIGVDTNSIMSDAKADISRFEPGLNQHQSLQIKLEYDGWQSNLQIFAALLGEPLTSILNHTLQLRDILPQSAYIGFTASTGRTDFESHRLLSWTFTSFPLPVKASSPSLHSKSIRRIVWLASIAASVGTLVVGIVALVVAKMARGSDSVRRDDMETRSRSAINAPRMFTYKQLVVATDNFNHKNLLGVGGFGSVYKGHAPGPIAVKKISAGSKQGEREFLAEICTIGRLRHKNVVQLNGWCHEKGQLLLVYEFMPNGSLDKFISKGLLPWDVRHRILSGIASALLYLHEECGTVVVHRDLKPNNVMLDEDFNAHLGDFGLARLVQEGSITTMVAGTPGYLAPECSYTGRATTESDVFGFGIVVLEVVCGRRLSELNLVDYIWGYYGQGQLLEAADVEPRDEFDQQQVMRALVVGLACAHPDPAQRPRMRGVVQVFMNSNEPLMELPTSRPAAIYIPVRQSTSKLSNGSGSNSALSVPPLSFNDITTLDCGR